MRVDCLLASPTAKYPMTYLLPPSILIWATTRSDSNARIAYRPRAHRPLTRSFDRKSPYRMLVSAGRGITLGTPSQYRLAFHRSTTEPTILIADYSAEEPSQGPLCARLPSHATRSVG